MNTDFGYVSRTAGAMPVWDQSAKTNTAQKEALNPNISFSEEVFSITDDYNSRLEIPQEEILNGFDGKREGGNSNMFFNMIDIVNPLQHIPVVSALYRNVTGDEINPVARIAGGGLYGGAIGAASATANAMIEVQTGKDIGDHVLNAFAGDKAAAEAMELVELPRSKKSYNHNSNSRYNA